MSHRYSKAETLVRRDSKDFRREGHQGAEAMGSTTSLSRSNTRAKKLFSSLKIGMACNLTEVLGFVTTHLDGFPFLPVSLNYYPVYFPLLHVEVYFMTFHSCA